MGARFFKPILCAASVAAAAASMPAFAAPGDTLFSDDFETGASCDPLTGIWTTTSTNLSGIGSQTSSSGLCSMFTRGDVVTITGPVVDLSGAAGADLTGWLRQGADAFSEDVDAGEDLTLEYIDSLGVWQSLITYPGADPPGTVELISFALPSNAMHANFQLRFRQIGGSGGPPSNGGIGYDYWHIDDIVITESGTIAPPPPSSNLAANTCDDFENGFGNWETSNSSRSGINSDTFNSSGNSMYLRHDTVTTTSLPFNSGGVNEMTVWVRRGADSFSENPDNGENLTLQYFNASSTWVSLETFTGSGSQGQIFNRTYALPTAAQHANFRVRFVYPFASGSDFDYWHIDDVCFNGAGPDFSVVKDVIVEQDPINGTSNPRGIPGAWATYSITVTNNGAGSVDAGSMTIGDLIDTNTTLFTGDFNGLGSPFRFTDGTGADASGLSLSFGGISDATDGVIFRDGVGTSMTPTGGFDPAVASFELQFNGAMNGTASGGNPTFTIEYRVLIE